MTNKIDKICPTCKYGATTVNLCIRKMGELPQSNTCDFWKYFDLEKELKYNMEH